MKASKGEIKIAEILEMNNISFQEEYSFSDLVGSKGQPLRFDFAVFTDDGELDFLIEYQGIQHYQPKSLYGGMSGLHKQQYYDMLKREYCKEHNITLVTIPYLDYGNISFDYIMMKAGYV